MDALRQDRRGTLTAADLAGISDFQLGDATVSPSRRTLTGPGGTATVEPRVMQVLVALAEHAGSVVSRETLFERCWGSVYVGEDSLNRVIGSLRRLGSDIASGSFEIETITRTGYRLVGELGEVARTSAGRSNQWTRRQLASGATAGLALGAIGGWAAFNSREENRFERLLREVDVSLDGDDNLFRPDQALRAAEAAVRIRPDSARALGLLALTRSYFAQVAPAERAASAAALATQTAQQALALDPREPNALLAMFEVQGSTLDWWSRDQLLRRIIALDSTNGLALGELASVLQAAGLCRESWDWNERLLRLAPLSQVCLARRALKLWIFGRVPDADNVINQTLAQYPTSKWVWSIRLLIYAFTGRAAAAMAMIDGEPKMLANGAETRMWRACLEALDRRSAATIARAREACLEAAPGSGELFGVAVMTLAALGDLDAAFDAANGHLLGRGKVVPRGRAATDALHRIDTYSLFMPPCKNMRADKRFLPLCEGVGLAEYWRRRGVRPDYERLDRATLAASPATRR